MIGRGLRRLAVLLLLGWLGGLAWFVWGVSQPVADPDSATDAVAGADGAGAGSN